MTFTKLKGKIPGVYIKFLIFFRIVVFFHGLPFLFLRPSYWVIRRAFKKHITIMNKILNFWLEKLEKCTHEFNQSEKEVCNSFFLIVSEFNILQEKNWKFQEIRMRM